MKTSHLILYNITLLLIGILSIFFLLKKVGHETESLEYNLSVDAFGSVLEKGKLPDSILTAPNFITLYSVFSNTNPMEDVDSFMNNLMQEDIPFLKLADYQQELMDTKTRCDQVMLLTVVKKKSINTDNVSFLDVLIAMCISGLLGGILANLRGFFEFIREDSDFPKYLHVPYLLRPITGMLCGMLVFFLTSVILTSTTVSVETNILPFKAMITFMGIAIVAGFASQEFTEKLKAAASVLFGAALTQKEQTELVEVEDATSGNLDNSLENPDAPAFVGKETNVDDIKRIKVLKRSTTVINRD